MIGAAQHPFEEFFGDGNGGSVSDDCAEGGVAGGSHEVGPDVEGF